MLFYMLMLSIFLLRKLDMIEPIFALALPAIALYSLDIFHVRFPQLSWILGGGFPLINHFPLFFSGILFYKIKVNGLSTTRLALLAACLGLQLMLFNDGGRSREFVSLAQYAAMLVGYYILFALFIKGKLTFLVNRITLFLGGISYALYLVHQFLGMHILIPSFESLNMGFAAAAIASLAVVITIAWLVTYCVEKPAMKYIKTIYKNRKAVQTAGTNPAEAMETPGLQVQPVNNEHN
jgi:peptidoglycan/LPS O-acetylase OafA/YrhL